MGDIVSNTSDPGQANVRVKSADRTIDILETLAASRSRLSLGELARSLKIPKSSLHGILQTLIGRKWVDIDASGVRYGLGVRALRAGAAYVEMDEVVSVATPVLDWLLSEAQETVQFGRLDGADIVYLAKRDSPQPLRLYSAIGRRRPAHATALGKAVLANLDFDTDVQHRLSWPLVAMTKKTICDREALRAELALTRDRGFAFDNEEAADGLRCMAVPLETASPIEDAVSIAVPLFRLNDAREQQLLQLLFEAKKRIETSYRVSPLHR